MPPLPFNLPPVPPLPFYIHPLIFWSIVLVIGILFAVTFLRFLFAPPEERTGALVIFVLMVVGVVLLYAVVLNAPFIIYHFKRLTHPIFRW
ncbi:hypothetical protein [uncultured Thermanaerothrix sp.]|uniref:hypothetical protein n=1 Tax=uncultured Thermanaerothrix sp. TaxID=1195149 RepID=UPI0026152D73|nr:hypothetical protein [uncultured Thermanaerothrix sp.]